MNKVILTGCILQTMSEMMFLGPYLLSSTSRKLQHREQPKFCSWESGWGGNNLKISLPSLDRSALSPVEKSGRLQPSKLFNCSIKHSLSYLCLKKGKVSLESNVLRCRICHIGIPQLSPYYPCYF